MLFETNSAFSNQISCSSKQIQRLTGKILKEIKNVESVLNNFEFNLKNAEFNWKWYNRFEQVVNVAYVVRRGRVTQSDALLNTDQPIRAPIVQGA